MWTLIVMTWLGGANTGADKLEFPTQQACIEERLNIEGMLRRYGEENTGKFYWIVGSCTLTVDDPS